VYVAFTFELKTNKAYELRKQEEPALVLNLNKFRAELVGLRTSKVSSAPQVKLARIRVVRKAIAKVLTVLNEKRRAVAKELHSKKKYTPYDLRWKNSTKASRKGLNKHQLALQTLKAAKKSSNFKPRKFAVAA
jgi:large subunit ribosomal protein L35e